MMKNGENGSVMMEFIIVLPIYMLLLGFAFVTGDFALDAIHLAGSADRMAALAAGEFQRYASASSPATNDWSNGSVSPLTYGNDPMFETASATVSRYRINGTAFSGKEIPPARYAVDGEIAGPWLEMVAARVEDDYTLPPWTRGMVAYWYREKYNMAAPPETVGGPLSDMLTGSGLKRTTILGKDLSANPVGENSKREYGHYTLRRHDGGRAAYRRTGSGRLGEDWVKCRDEKLPWSDAEDRVSQYARIDGGTRTGHALAGTVNAADIPALSRDGDLKSWSD